MTFLTLGLRLGRIGVAEYSIEFGMGDSQTYLTHQKALRRCVRHCDLEFILSNVLPGPGCHHHT